MTLLNRFSMRASLIATIVVMGLLGLALALFTARLYESVAREAHQAALAELLFHRITDLSRDIGPILLANVLFAFGRSPARFTA